jgi:hypothetical protein
VTRTRELALTAAGIVIIFAVFLLMLTIRPRNAA